jgi:hypothetical protein
MSQNVKAASTSGPRNHQPQKRVTLVLDKPISRFSKFLSKGQCQTSLILEPISKSPEEDNEAGELDEAEEVLGVIFPADEDAALPLDPSEEALDQPASHVAA